jgi:chaperone BCS1
VTLDPALIQSGLLLGLVGTIIATLRSIPGRIFGYARSRLYLECSIDSDDSLYYWLTVWLSGRLEPNNVGSLRVVSRYGDSKPTAIGSSDDSAPARAPARSVSLVPGDGDHVLHYEGVRFWISSSTSSEAPMSQSRLRTMRIKTWMRHRPVLERMLAEVADMEHTPDQDLTKVLISDGYGWRMASRRRRRTLESVVLPDDIGASLLREAKAFLAAESEYARLGVPHRWGVLLDGPPGNGKSSLALALAGELRSPLYVLSLGDPNLSDDRLQSLMAAVPAGSVVSAEDVDAIFEGRERQAENKLTFSGLLNAIDGPLASEGRILILTTNRIDVLDPALIRPGRIDRRITLGNATEAQARMMWRRFSRPADGEDRFVRWAADGERSMASVQERLLHERELLSAS